MLSFAVVHALTSCLITADTDADAMGWGQPATLLLIHDRPDGSAGPAREIRSLEFPLRPDDMPTAPAGLPVLLHRLADSLHHRARRTPYPATLATIVRLIRATAPDARLLAWAACYDDIHTRGGQPKQVRRVDAVDVDGRLYQLTHLHGEDHPVVLVDDTPDLHNVPATHPGLVALLTATARYIPPVTRRRRSVAPPVTLPPDPDEPVFSSCGPDGASLRCLVCGAVDELTVTELPSMAGYGEDTTARCNRCGSVETTDPIFGWRAKPAPWPRSREHCQP